MTSRILNKTAGCMEVPFAGLEKTMGSTDLGRKQWRSYFGSKLKKSFTHPGRDVD